MILLFSLFRKRRNDSFSVIMFDNLLLIWFCKLKLSVCNLFNGVSKTFFGQYLRAVTQGLLALPAG